MRCDGKMLSLVQASGTYFHKHVRPLWLELSRLSDQVIGWTIRGSNPGWGNRFFSAFQKVQTSFGTRRAFCSICTEGKEAGV